MFAGGEREIEQERRFVKIRGTFLGGPHNKDSNILGPVFGSPYLGKLPNPAELKKRKKVPFDFLEAVALEVGEAGAGGASVACSAASWQFIPLWAIRP